MVSETMLGIVGLIALCFPILALCEFESERLKRQEAEEEIGLLRSQLEQPSMPGS